LGVFKDTGKRGGAKNLKKPRSKPLVEWQKKGGEKGKKAIGGSSQRNGCPRNGR